ncbi:hypothetical protein [Actinokineospora sp. NBRC 105648]|uniref:hypothetical protein n=1 Tax=Actinokineospora sp. NBRC 105648 TaxID=3032206 RepID=UPI0024A2A370|nr:hypothetical protein [Actinokineospora sp. NBRC 105648]GLZ39417.1 hypothetical protein Acsp05_30410 [Actinokineospora sp. NBRC 105648]
MRLKLLLLLCLAVFAAGCTEVVSPPPSAAKPVPDYVPSSVDVAAALGDLTTLDPCSLVEPVDFGADRAMDPGSLDECAFTVNPGGGGPSVFSVGLVEWLAQIEDHSSIKSEKGFRHARYSAPLVPCGRLVLVDDKMALTAQARQPTEGPKPAGLCEALDRGFAKVLERLAKGPSAVRHRVFPANSVATANACGALPRTVADSFPKYRNWPAEHMCEWTDATTTLRISFGVGSSAPFGAPQRPVAGRPTGRLELPGGSEVHCVLNTTHIPFGAGGARENVRLTLAVKGGVMAQVCDRATGLAEQVWAGLPRVG